ncbi:MAG TPA: BON domain-containing protein [Bacteriovoracaceae bacterium]|nr:BON domain-containing protein [Bacteriovoracaceae bacterium]
MRHLRDDRQSFESNWSKDSRSEAFRENHFGKGPKGYKRSDELIFEEACDALAIDRHLDATFMEMEVKDGCIYLRGEATSRDDKRLAEEIVEHIMGVSDVQNQLIVRKNSTSPLQHRSLAENESGGLLRGLT